MERIILALLIPLSVSTQAQFQSVTINGIISFHEKRDSTDFKIIPTTTEDFLLKRNQDYYYIGIHNATVASSNVILNRGDEFIIIHISACTGRAVYKKIPGDSLKVTKPLLHVREHPEAWDVRGMWVSNTVLKTPKDSQQMTDDMQTCLKNFGYMASTIDLGSYRDAEMLIDRNVFKGYKMLLQNTQSQMGFYPIDGFTDDLKLMRTFLDAREKTLLKIELNTESWIEI